MYHMYTERCKFVATCVVARRSDGEGKFARRRNKKARDFTDPFIHKSTLLSSTWVILRSLKIDTKLLNSSSKVQSTHGALSHLPSSLWFTPSLGPSTSWERWIDKEMAPTLSYKYICLGLI